MPFISLHEILKMNRKTITCLAVVGTGVVLVGAGTYYFLYRIYDLLQRELSDINAKVCEIKRDISDLKAASKRKGIAAGSSFSDETSDVYYDFTDDGETSSVTSDDGLESSDDLQTRAAHEVDSSPFNAVNDMSVDSHHMSKHSSRVDASNYRSTKSRKSLKSKKSVQESLSSVDKMLEELAEIRSNCENFREKILSLHDQFYTNYEYLWRAAKTCHLCGVIAGENGNTTLKRESMQEGLKYAAAALALTDDDANVHKWYAICIGSCSEFENTQTKIKYGFTVKEHAQLALKLNPSDESLHYLMGRWCYEVAMMSWIERKVATTIFGEIPSASLPEARSYFLTVEKLNECNGIWRENRLYLAKTYIAEREYYTALHWLDKASDESPVNSSRKETPQVLQEIENLKSQYKSYGRYDC